MDVSAEQPLKVKDLIRVTPLGIEIEISDLHPLKAASPMFVTLLGMVMDVSAEQSPKA